MSLNSVMSSIQIHLNTKIRKFIMNIDMLYFINITNIFSTDSILNLIIIININININNNLKLILV